MNIKVTKLTDVNLLQKVASYTTGRECKMTLRTAYRCMHSIIRSQIFLIELTDIPLFVASQMVRSHVGVQFYQRSKRTDRGGEDFRKVCHRLSSELEGIEEDNSEGVGYISTSSVSEEIEMLPDRFDRYAPSDLAMLINAEAVINMSHKRLCAKASTETREIWQAVCDLIEEQDPDLYKFCVKPCVHKGFCSEAKSCGFCKTELFSKLRENYLKLFINVK